MIFSLALLGIGAGVLYLGAETAVRNATGLARAGAAGGFVLGALLFGIDVEGLGTALAAAARNQPQIAAGEVFGTALFVVGAAFAAALVVSPKPVPSPSRAMVAAPAFLVAAAALTLYDRHVARYEGVFLLLLYLVYMGIVVREGRAVRAASAAAASEAAQGSARRMLIATLAGMALLAGGALLLVAGGSRLLELTSLSGGFVGAAIVAVLTSLDEVLLAVLPLRRGTPELATGNLFGTLAAFTSAALGLAALVRPLDVDSAAALALLGAALLYAIVGTAFLVRGRAGRPVGLACLVLYAAWLAFGSTV